MGTQGVFPLSLLSFIRRCKHSLSSHTCAIVSLYLRTQQCQASLETLIISKHNLEKSKQLQFSEICAKIFLFVENYWLLSGYLSTASFNLTAVSNFRMKNGKRLKMQFTITVFETINFLKGKARAILQFFICAVLSLAYM